MARKEAALQAERDAIQAEKDKLAAEKAEFETKMAKLKVGEDGEVTVDGKVEGQDLGVKSLDSTASSSSIGSPRLTPKSEGSVVVVSDEKKEEVPVSGAPPAANSSPSDVGRSYAAPSA